MKTVLQWFATDLVITAHLVAAIHMVPMSSSSLLANIAESFQVNLLALGFRAHHTFHHLIVPQ